MLANELDQYKGKGNSYVEENIQEIQELYMDKEEKRNEGRVEDKEVILIKPYEVSSSTSISTHCYDLKLKVSSNKTTLVLSNTRELNRVPSTK